MLDAIAIFAPAAIERDSRWRKPSRKTLSIVKRTCELDAETLRQMQLQHYRWNGISSAQHLVCGGGASCMFSDARPGPLSRSDRRARAQGSRQAALINRIRAALEKDIRINLHRFPIALSFDGTDLVLAGNVEHIAAKKITLELAAAIDPTLRIVDRLKVTPSAIMGDREIRDHVVKALLAEPALKHCLISSRLAKESVSHRQTIPEPIGTIVVEVSDGAVTLDGEVPSLSHKRLAGVLAWWVPGCRDVINSLEEVPPEQDNQDNDNELTDAVRLALEKDPFINASKIRVRTKDWIVTLAGLVPNQIMKQMAERDAWSVLGVKEVVNRLQIKW
jgi:osmotically-inducible protein OsmY